MQVAAASDGDRAFDNQAHGGIHCRYPFLDSGVGFFPESRDAAHACGAHLFYYRLDFSRVGVDIYFDSSIYAEVGPGFLEDVAQGQEAQ